MHRAHESANSIGCLGSLARIGPNDLVTNDPGVLRRILGVRTQYKRSNWYDAMRFNPAHDSVLSEQNDEKHNLLRTKMATGVCRCIHYHYIADDVCSTRAKKTTASR